MRIRTGTKRPGALDKLCFALVGIDEHSLMQMVEVAAKLNEAGDLVIFVTDYAKETVRTKVVRNIQGYMVVWIK